MNINPYKVHQYVDGEMSLKQRKDFEKEMVEKPTLKQQVCELQAQKLAMRQIYSKIKNPGFPVVKPKTFVQWKAIAASLMLGFFLGFSLFFVYSPYSEQTIEKLALSSKNFVVHLDTNKPEKLYATLERARYLLEKNPQSKVQIVANHEGVELFNAENSTADQVIQLLNQYHNLEMMACRRTIERAEKQGKPINVLPKVSADEPAVDEVVKRLKQGWTYIKI